MNRLLFLLHWSLLNLKYPLIPSTVEVNNYKSCWLDSLQFNWSQAKINCFLSSSKSACYSESLAEFFFCDSLSHGALISNWLLLILMEVEIMVLTNFSNNETGTDSILCIYVSLACCLSNIHLLTLITFIFIGLALAFFRSCFSSYIYIKNFNFSLSSIVAQETIIDSFKWSLEVSLVTNN